MGRLADHSTESRPGWEKGGEKKENVAADLYT